MITRQQPDTATAAPGGRLRRIGRGANYVLHAVLIEPIREGRLRDDGWPPGMRGIVLTGALFAVLLTAMTALASPIRRHSPLLLGVLEDTTLPRAAAPVLAAAMIFAFGALYTALLHAQPVVRIIGLLLLLAAPLSSIDLPGNVTGEDLPALIAVAGMIIFAGLRWRSAFGWGEYVIATVLVTIAVGGQLAVESFSSPGVTTDRFMLQLANLQLTLAEFALPFAALAGSALTELVASFSIATSTAIGARADGHRLDDRGDQPAAGPTRRWPSRMALLIMLLVLARAVQLGLGLRQHSLTYLPMPLLAGAAMILVPTLGLAVIYRFGSGRSWFGLPSGQELLAQWKTWAVLISVIVAAGAIWTNLLGSLLQAVGLNSFAQALSRLPGSVSMIIGAAAGVLALCGLAVSAWRRRRSGGLSLLLIIFAITQLEMAIFQVSGLATSLNGAFLTADLLALAAGAMWLARRRLTRNRLITIAAVLLISLLYDYRDILAEPLTRLFLLSGASAGLLIGSVWRLITDNTLAAGDSERFPRSTRVLFVVANAIFGTLLIAMQALQGGYGGVSLDLFEQVGETALGSALIIAVLTGLLIRLGFGPEPAASPTPTDLSSAASVERSPDRAP